MCVCVLSSQFPVGRSFKGGWNAFLIKKKIVMIWNDGAECRGLVYMLSLGCCCKTGKQQPRFAWEASGRVGDVSLFFWKVCKGYVRTAATSQNQHAKREVFLITCGGEVLKMSRSQAYQSLSLSLSLSVYHAFIFSFRNRGWIVLKYKCQPQNGCNIFFYWALKYEFNNILVK